MTTYKVAGTRTVAGVEPGGTVTDGDLEGCNIDALISGGHLAAPSTTKAKEGCSWPYSCKTRSP